MANIIKRSDGWSQIPDPDLKKLYFALSAKLDSLRPFIEVAYEETSSQATLAENFGKYVRESFSLYSSILEDMKQSQDWIALQVRSTYHSKASYPDSIIIGEENDLNQVQISGFYFNPTVFKFSWVDNSMTQPWKPWDWRLGLFSQDLDEVHYFFDLKSDKLFFGEVSKIVFYNFKPNLPEKLSLFKLQIPKL